MIKNASQPLVSIITINCDQLDVTLEFLQSTKKLLYSNYEVIVVDNASTDDPTEVIRFRYPEVKFVRNQKNLGFSGGNNVGIELARGDFYFIVNNDTEVTPNLLDKLIEPFLDDKMIGVVSPKIHYFSHPNIIQYAGYSKINPYTGRNQPFGFKQEDRGQFDKAGYTAYAHGAAMMVKKEVVDTVGRLPAIFFIYYEELDWSEQIRKAGYRIFYQSSALIYHKESMTMGKESLRKAYFQNRNRVLFMRRNATRFQFTCFIVFLVLAIIPSKIVQYARRGQFKHIVVFLQAMAWNFNPKRIYPITKEKKITTDYDKIFDNGRGWLYRFSRGKTLP